MEGGLACSAALWAHILGHGGRQGGGRQPCVLCPEGVGRQKDRKTLASLGGSSWGRLLPLSQAPLSRAPPCSLHPRGGRVFCWGWRGVPLLHFCVALPLTRAHTPQPSLQSSGLHATQLGSPLLHPTPSCKGSPGPGCHGSGHKLSQGQVFPSPAGWRGLLRGLASPSSLILFPVFIPLD